MGSKIDRFDDKTLLIVRRRNDGLTWREIAAEVGLTGQACYNRVKARAPHLIGKFGKDPWEVDAATGKNIRKKTGSTRHSQELKLRPIPPWQPPKTGSESGFIRPIPFEKLTGARAR